MAGALVSTQNIIHKFSIMTKNRSSVLINPLNPNTVGHLIFPNTVISKSHSNVMTIKEIITN